MKKVFYSVLLFASTGIALAACSNGDYNANPASSANASVNPLTPLDSAALAAFVTSAAPSFITANIDGSVFTASGDTGSSFANYFFVDTTGANRITGVSGGKILQLSLANVYSGNIYKMQNKIMDTRGLYASRDSSGNSIGAHYSNLGNSGEVQILENDAAAIRGTFYFQAIDSLGNVINVNNGYFYVSKTP